MRLESIAIEPKRLTEGVWWDYETQAPCKGSEPHPTHFCVRVVPRGSAFYRCIEDLRQPYWAEIKAGTLPIETAMQIRGEALGRFIAKEFANGEWQGRPLGNDEKSRIALLSDPRLDNLCIFIENAADNRSVLLAREEEEAKGN